MNDLYQLFTELNLDVEMQEQFLRSPKWRQRLVGETDLHAQVARIAREAAAAGEYARATICGDPGNDPTDFDDPQKAPPDVAAR